MPRICEVVDAMPNSEHKLRDVNAIVRHPALPNAMACVLVSVGDVFDANLCGLPTSRSSAYRLQRNQVLAQAIGGHQSHIGRQVAQAFGGPRSLAAAGPDERLPGLVGPQPDAVACRAGTMGLRLSEAALLGIGTGLVVGAGLALLMQPLIALAVAQTVLVLAPIAAICGGHVGVGKALSVLWRVPTSCIGTVAAISLAIHVGLAIGIALTKSDSEARHVAERTAEYLATIDQVALMGGAMVAFGAYEAICRFAARYDAKTFRGPSQPAAAKEMSFGQTFRSSLRDFGRQIV